MAWAGDNGAFLMEILRQRLSCQDKVNMPLVLRTIAFYQSLLLEEIYVPKAMKEDWNTHALMMFAHAIPLFGAFEASLNET